MRDSDQNPLSITHRQHDALMQFIGSLKSPSVVAGRAESPIARTIESFGKFASRKKPKA
jgi:hypothetical protein